MNTKEILQFVKSATTKAPTTIAGTETFFFKDGYVTAYNNVVSIKGKIDLDIEGSVHADKFYQLLNKIQNEYTCKNNDKSVKISYGRSSATIRKIVKGLQVYVDILFPEGYMLQPIPADFMECLAKVKFNGYSNKLSGIFIDDDIYYSIGNSSSFCTYKGAEGFGEAFWIPSEALPIIMNIPEEINECALSRGCLYLFTDNFTVAVKLKIAEQFPLKTVEGFLEGFNDFTHTMELPQDTQQALARVMLSTSQDANTMFHKCFLTTKKDMLIVTNESHKTEMEIHEEFPYDSFKLEEHTYDVPIEKFLELLQKSNKIHIIKGKVRGQESYAFGIHDESITQILTLGMVQ